MKSDLLREELVNSYQRREYDLQYDARDKPEDREILKEETVQEEYFKDHLARNPIEKCQTSDIERVYDFPLKLFRRIFPSLNFGYSDFVEKHLWATKKFSILLTKENFKLIKILEGLRDS